MSLLGRAEALSTKHASLEQALHNEAMRPIPDAMKVRQLKALKLMIKDELARLDDPPQLQRQH